MSEYLPNVAVTAVMEEGPKSDRQAKIAEMEAQLAKVRKEIEKQQELERHWQILETAFNKLRKELGKTLTREEYQAIDGAYLFLHGGCVDLVRHIPSNTDRGEGKRLESVMDYGEKLAEAKELETALADLR